MSIHPKQALEDGLDLFLFFAESIRAT